MKLTYNTIKGVFILQNIDANVDPAKLGFEEEDGKYVTRVPSTAHLMKSYADEHTKTILKRLATVRRYSTSLTLAKDIHSHPNKSLYYLPFQKVDIFFASRLSPRCLIAEEPGCGKSVISAGIINECEDVKKVLIVCPASLRPNWSQEISKWVFRELDKIEIVSYDSVWRDKYFSSVLSEDWGLIICDEAHYLKEPTSKRSQAVLALSKKTERLVLLTGTPVKNKPKDLYNLVKIINPKLFPDYNSFGLRYCGGFLQKIYRYNHKTKRVEARNVWNFDGASNLNELQDILRSTVMVRRDKRDILPQLPRKVRQIIEIPANFKSFKDEQKLWKTVCEEVGYDDAVKSLEDGIGVAFNEMAKARKQVAIDKVDVVVDYIKDLMESVDKVVLFAHHRDVVSALFDGLKEFNPVKFVGGMKDKDKDTSVKTFQNDPNCRIFIGNISAAGVGITLTASSTVVFAEASYVPSDLAQAEDRCARIGAAASSVLVQYLVLQNSLDAEMLKKTVKKQEIADKILEDTLDL